MRRAPTNRIGAAVLAAAIGLAVLVPFGPALAFDLGQLVQTLKLSERREIGFREVRKFEALTSELVSTGQFVFEPPDRLIKKMVTPRREQAVIEGGRLTMMDEEGTETASVDLADHPTLGRVFPGLLALLGGDEKALTEIFVPGLSGDAGDWTLRLTPRGPRENGAPAGLDRMVVTGGAQIGTLEIWETSGDYTRITLLPQPAQR